MKYYVTWKETIYSSAEIEVPDHADPEGYIRDQIYDGSVIPLDDSDGIEALEFREIPSSQEV